MKPPEAIKFDPTFLLAQVDQDQEMLQVLFTTFSRTYSEKLGELKAFAQAGNAVGVAEVAHYLKGDLGTMGHPPAIEVIQKIEQLGQSGNLKGVQELVIQLEQVAQPILDFITISSKAIK